MYKNDSDVLISIIVPVYNVEKYLEMCVDSIITQTYSNLEIILVDDGSTDKSGEICDVYAEKDRRIQVIHKENGGLSDARNAGLEIACGEYIGFVDSDDYIESDMFEQMFRQCEDKGAQMSCVRYDEVGEGADTVPQADGNVKILTSKQYLKNILIGNEDDFSNYHVMERLYHKKILEGLRFTVGKCFEDILFSTKAILNAKNCIYINKICYHYRIREGSITHSAPEAVIERRWITDQMQQERESVDYMLSRGYRELGNIAKAMYYQQASYYYALNTHQDLDDDILRCIKAWRLKNAEIYALPFDLKKKFFVWFKMAMPKLSQIIYKVKYSSR